MPGPPCSRSVAAAAAEPDKAAAGLKSGLLAAGRRRRAAAAEWISSRALPLTCRKRRKEERTGISGEERGNRRRVRSSARIGMSGTEQRQESALPLSSQREAPSSHCKRASPLSASLLHVSTTCRRHTHTATTATPPSPHSPSHDRKTRSFWVEYAVKRGRNEGTRLPDRLGQFLELRPRRVALRPEAQDILGEGLGRVG